MNSHLQLQHDETTLFYVVGSGITGCVIAERIATLFGRRVVVFEKRPFVGGNSYADIDAETGIEIHRYGSHIFHTTNETIWNYIRKFTDFNSYRHRVMLHSGGRVYSMPIDLKTINDFYGTQFSPDEARSFLAGEIQKEGIAIVQNLEEKAMSLVGKALYERMIRDYTAKQWGRDPKDLPESIINRLPVRYRYDDAYFETPWQGIPAKGFDAMFKALLTNPLIEVRTDVDYFDVRNTIPKEAIVIYTGMIDRLFDYCYGPLEWRSLRFELETVPVRDFQGTSVMNYGNPEVPFTRIHEFKHYHPEWTSSFEGKRTVICREFPQDWMPGVDAFYPVNDDANQRRLAKYRAELAKFPNLFIGGRLGQYKYCDMDGAIADALVLVDDLGKRLPS